MDEITQQNAALVEQAAAASESMQAQAQKLAELVGAFRLVPSGHAGQAARRDSRQPPLPLTGQRQALLAGSAA